MKCRYLIVLTVLAVNVFATHAKAESRSGPMIARKILTTWSCQDKLGVARTPVTFSPWSMPKHSGAFAREQMNNWTLRYRACKATLDEKKRQWNWQAWLPDKWVRIARCETGINWFHSNSRFQGAFGFAISSWDSFRLAGYPAEAWQASPWQQYQVALAIHSRYGFSGWGCRNA